jgi:hypothetical protein
MLAKQFIGEKLLRRQWASGDLKIRRNGDPAKLALCDTPRVWHSQPSQSPAFSFEREWRNGLYQ